MHGCGNDFIVINNHNGEYDDINMSELAKKLCQRTSVGADQLITLVKGNKVAFKMNVHNADGSSAETCGNALRCLALFIRDEKLSTDKEIKLETVNNINTLKINTNKTVTVDMGIAEVKEPRNLSLYDENRNILMREVREINVGNPHAVMFVSNLDYFSVQWYGQLIENHDDFQPERINVEFVQFVNEHCLKMRVWERGSGETLACGTGACASAVAHAITQSLFNQKITVQQRGGNLDIQVSKDLNVLMTGEAKQVFQGTVDV